MPGLSQDLLSLPSFGLSFPVIWLGVLYAIIVLRHWDQLSSNNSYVVYSLVAGYCLLAPTYGWVESVLIYPSKESNYEMMIGHLLSFALAYLVLKFVVEKITVKQGIIDTNVQKTASLSS